MKHTKEYKWSFDRVNSKGEKIFKHDTGEELDEVLEYLEENSIEYSIRSGATMLWILNDCKRFSYYWTTGRWAPFREGGWPKKHYSSKGIEDFVERFLYNDREYTNED